MKPAAALASELKAARRQTDLLFGLISPEALYSRPISERHRLIFYLGHFDAFDWNLLGRRGLNAPSFHPTFDALFERGIDPPPGEVPNDTPHDWPCRPEVEKYNLSTREWIDAHLNDMDPATIHMAIEHRLMHAETFAYLMHNLPYTDKTGGPAPQVSIQPAPENPMAPIAYGTALLGQSPEAFGWDNEFAAHRVPVKGFAISKYKITNGEYLRFVNAGGSPSHFWANESGQWLYRGMFGRIPLPLDHPVWVTWQQAQAYAQWRGLKLPTEAQFHCAQTASPDPATDNFDFNSWDPIPVTVSGGEGPAQLTGNGWEWTRDIFAPFEGFEAHPHYPGYSADFFDGQHYVMKGASPRTAKRMARTSFRNWFRPEYPHMYAGFRLVQD
jgi:formylglycine-generating enzyme required for sulfatase activity